MEERKNGRMKGSLNKQISIFVIPFVNPFYLFFSIVRAKSVWAARNFSSSSNSKFVSFLIDQSFPHHLLFQFVFDRAAHELRGHLNVT